MNQLTAIDLCSNVTHSHLAPRIMQRMNLVTENAALEGDGYHHT